MHVPTMTTQLGSQAHTVAHLFTALKPYGQQDSCTLQLTHSTDRAVSPVRNRQWRLDRTGARRAAWCLVILTSYTVRYCMICGAMPVRCGRPGGRDGTGILCVKIPVA